MLVWTCKCGKVTYRAQDMPKSDCVLCFICGSTIGWYNRGDGDYSPHEPTISFDPETGKSYRVCRICRVDLGDLITDDRNR